MQLAIKGIYENGIIRPLEKLDLDVAKTEVIIVFLEQIQKKAKEHFLKCAGKWKNFDTEGMKKKIYESRRSDTRRKVKL